MSAGLVGWYLWETRRILLVTNVGSGVGFNLRVVKTNRGRIEWELESNFASWVHGAAVTPGLALDTGEALGAVGTMKDEVVQLFYESLSGKRYASIVSFSGRGLPLNVTFVLKD